MRMIFAAVALLGVSGCASPQQQAEEARQADVRYCFDRGITAADPMWMQCQQIAAMSRVQQQATSDAQIFALGAGLQNYGNQMQQQPQVPAYRPPQQTYCRNTQFGVNCTTY